MKERNNELKLKEVRIQSDGCRESEKETMMEGRTSKGKQGSVNLKR